MVALASIRVISEQKKAQDSWEDIGHAILGRSRAVSSSSVSYKEGMSPEAIIALANEKSSSRRKV